MGSKLVAGITGAGGFIGGYLRDALDAHVSVRPHYRKNPHHSDSRAHIGDLKDQQKTWEFLTGLDTLIHLANSNFPRDSKTRFSEDIQSNLITTIQLFEAFAELNPNGHIIFFSSGGTVYDATLPPAPRSELDRVRPTSSYGIQKLAAEQFLEAICKRTGVRGTVFRLSNPYGIPLDLNRAQGIIGVAISCLITQRPLTIFGSMEAVRDYIHLDDVSSAVLKAIQSPPPCGNCRVLNLGTGEGVQTSVLLKEIQDVAGTVLKVIHGEVDLREVPWNVLDISKTRGELGWEPRVSLGEGLKRTYLLAHK